MKNDVLMYENVYEILKDKIESGRLPRGSRLPSRAELCKAFGTSEKSVRRAVELLADEGFVKTEKRKRPVVAFNPVAQPRKKAPPARGTGAFVTEDTLKTGVLLCFPLIAQGLKLCQGDEWAVPQAIIDQMDPGQPVAFWRLSKRLWRFFVARTGNALALRAVDCLGYTGIDPLSGTQEMREGYLESIRELFECVRQGGSFESIHFGDFSALYDFVGMAEKKAESRSGSALPVSKIDQKLTKAERYSSVYLDIISLIAVGYYKPGDRLPTHEALRKIYNVSVDTTVRAVQILQEWGVVEATPGKGIFVTMDLDGLKKLTISPGMIASHVRRFLDSLELLSLTVEGVAVHAAENASASEAQELYDEIDRLWNRLYLYDLTPRVLLNFITEHIQYYAMRSIYGVIQKNQHVGRSIPNLVNPVKTAVNCELHEQCMEAVGFLMEGRPRDFARKATEMFDHTRELVIGECRRLGYWEAAMAVYDGDLLWK